MHFTICILIFLFTSLSGLAGSFAHAKIVPVKHYARMPMIDDAAISPDGKWLAAVVDFEGKYIVRVFNLANPSDKKIRVKALDKKSNINWVKWSGNDIILVSTRHKIMIGQTLSGAGNLFALNRDLTEARQLLKPKSKRVIGTAKRRTELRQFSNNVIDFLPNDPNHILMSYGLSDRFKPDVIKVDVRNTSIENIKQGEEGIQTWVTDLRSEPRIGIGLKDESGRVKMIIRDAHSKKWRHVNDYPGLDATAAIYGFMQDPNELIIGLYDGKDTRGLFIYDLAKKQRTRKLFQNDQYDVSGIVLSRDGTKVIGASYIADVGKTVFFDSQYKSRFDKIRKKLDGYNIQYVDQTVDGNIIVFKASTPSVPNSLMHFNVAQGRVSFITCDYPEIGNIVQGDVTKISYKTRDGVKIPAYLTTPPKIADGMPLKNLPFIIMPHGGPHARDSLSFDYLAQFMASRGYAVLQMNFRGSQGYGKKFADAGRKNWVVMQDDVEDGTRWLIKKGYADPNRVCIVGWSYGGYAALMAAIKNPELYACALSMAGVTDLQDMVRDMKQFRFGKITAQNSLLQGFEGRDDMKQNSPVKRAKEITIPLMLAHGEDDIVVYFDQYKRMKRALRKSSAKVTYVPLKNESHYLQNSENRLIFFNAMDKFLAENLGPSAAAP
ncbi:MAG: S9 family peptidase [Robiginitomaculum sp.]|nr:S9 family peptidase [Robiginitomaculum sp.]